MKRFDPSVAQTFKFKKEDAPPENSEKAKLESGKLEIIKKKQP